MKAFKNKAVQSGNIQNHNISYEQRVRANYEGRVNLPIITKGSDAWHDWMEYFNHIGHAHAHPNSVANRLGRLTVPELMPEMFDPTWRDREPVAFTPGTYPPKKKYKESEGKPQDPIELDRQRKRIAEMFADLMKTLGSSGLRSTSRDRRDAEAEKRAAQEWLLKNPRGVVSEKPIVSDRFSQLLEEMFPKQAAE